MVYFISLFESGIETRTPQKLKEHVLPLSDNLPSKGHTNYADTTEFWQEGKKTRQHVKTKMVAHL